MNKTKSVSVPKNQKSLVDYFNRGVEVGNNDSDAGVVSDDEGVGELEDIWRDDTSDTIAGEVAYEDTELSTKESGVSGGSRKRAFMVEWKHEFPWLQRVGDNEVICAVCERDSGDRTNDWATGKFCFLICVTIFFIALFVELFDLLT